MTRYDYPEVIEQVRKGLPYASFETFQKSSGLAADQLVDVLQIPRRTMARRKKSGRFSPDESDRLVRVARVYAKALQLFDGDAREATRWFLTVRSALAGATPLEMTRTSVGAQEVEDLIGRIEHGVFT
jgi:putative toxin-antitoxin system antitoxin component (TIGR02293 family)